MMKSWNCQPRPNLNINEQLLVQHYLQHCRPPSLEVFVECLLFFLLIEKVSSVCLLSKDHASLISLAKNKIQNTNNKNNIIYDHVQRNPLHCSKVGATSPGCTRRPSFPELRHTRSSIAAPHCANSRCTSAAPIGNGRATPPSIATMGE